MAGRANAQAVNYIGPDGGDWSVATNWSLYGVNFVPGNDEDAALGETGTATYMTMDYAYTGSGLAELAIGATAEGSFTVNQSSEVMISSTETIGFNYGESNYDQSGGTNTINAGGALNIADGSYMLSNLGYLQLGSSAEITVGIYPGSDVHGIFSQTGGAVTDGNGGSSLVVGGQAGSSGAYSLSGGVLYMSNESISVSGSFIQTGGMNIVDEGDYSLDGLYIGNSSVAGSYSLSENGTLGLASGNANLVVGANGAGSFSQSGGTVTDYNNGAQLIVGYQVGSSGTYSMSAGSISISNEYIGASGGGSFIQAGGTNTVTGSTMSVGDGAGSVGLYTLSNGTLSLAAPSNMNLVVGKYGTGSFFQSGGAVTNTNGFDSLIVGDFAESSGTYGMCAGAVTMFQEYIGGSGSGSFIQTGGTNTVTGAITVGNNLGGVGSYTLSNGTLTINNDGSLTVGKNTTGTFTQSGGTVSGGFETFLVVGPSVVGSGGLGTYTLSGGALTMTIEEIGYLYAGGSMIQTGGTNTLPQDSYLGVGVGANATGLYTLKNGGTLSLTHSQFVIGDSGQGSFSQSGGTVTDNGSGAQLTVGSEFGSSGTYALSGGSLTISNEVIGRIGTGSFIQTGGTNTIYSNSFLYLGYGSGSSGTYTLGYNGTGGTLTLTSGGKLAVGESGVGTFAQYAGTLTLASGAEIDVGDSGAGTFTQSGGIVTDNNSGAQLLVGDQGGSSGTYNLIGGSVTLTQETIGYNGIGSFTQSGGTNLVTGSLSLGYGSGSGTYILEGGTNTVTQQLSVLGTTSRYSLEPATGTPVLSASAELIGSGGYFYQSGGTNTVIGLLQVGNGIAPSYYALGGGTLTAQEELVGSGGAYDSFGQGSGTNTIGTGGSLIIETGYYELGGGVLYAPNSVGGFVTQSQGAFFDMSGGTEYGYLQNFGEIAYTAGTFNGFLENDGTVYLHASFAVGSGILNNTTISVSSGLGIYGAGTGLDNEGELDLANGAVGGTSLLNDGLISGYGTIDGDNFSNYGLVTQGAGNLTLSATGANQNFSTITLASGRQLRLTGATLVNQGTLALSGGIVTGVAELDNSVGGLITGPGSILGPFSNDSGGTVQIAAGTVSVSQAFTNAGLISLTGVTANLTGAAVTNDGTIQGVGSVGSASVTNAGILEAIGGTLDVTGALINPSGGQILAGSGDKVLVTQGLASNAGLINLTGGTFDNNSHALTNTGQISGYGTFRTGGLTNDATATFTGGQTTVNGNVTNAGGATIAVAQNPATFTGNVTNGAGATFKTIGTTVTFSGTFTNNGSYISDPSTQNFTALAEGATGSISGGVGDVFNVSGNVLNTSTENTLFNLSQSQLTLQGSVIHTFEWPGADLGPSDAGYTDNFSIGIFELQAGGLLTLSGTGAAGAGIYVGVLDLDSILADGTQSAQLTALDDISNTITGNGSNIYYNPSLSGNSYLDGGTYPLAGGGDIIPTPEPGTWAMFAMATGAGLLEIRRRRAGKTVSKGQ